jgi:hypothetical protein
MRLKAKIWPLVVIYPIIYHTSDELEVENTPFDRFLKEKLNRTPSWFFKGTQKKKKNVKLQKRQYLKNPIFGHIFFSIQKIWSSFRWFSKWRQI